MHVRVWHAFVFQARTLEQEGKRKAGHIESGADWVLMKMEEQVVCRGERLYQLSGDTQAATHKHTKTPEYFKPIVHKQCQIELLIRAQPNTWTYWKCELRAAVSTRMTWLKSLSQPRWRVSLCRVTGSSAGSTTLTISPGKTAVAGINKHILKRRESNTNRQWGLKCTLTPTTGKKMNDFTCFECKWSV